MLKKKILSLSFAFLALGAIASLVVSSAVLQSEEATLRKNAVTYQDEPETTESISAGDYRLDFASSNLSFVWTNTKTNESLHSGRRAENDGLNSATWKGLMSDGLSVNYRNNSTSHLAPFSTLKGSATVTASGSTLKIQVALNKIAVQLEMDLTLNEDGSLDLEIPFSSIQENAKDAEKEEDRYQLSSLVPFLGLGDSFGLQEKGSFLFLPDGCGAIADLSIATIASQEYNHRIGGLDLGVLGNNGALRIASSNPEKTILLPVSGLAYSNDPGVFYRVKEGAPYADINASVSGIANNGYSYSAPRFNYREEYFQYVDKSGANGKNAYLQNPYSYDAKVHYFFLPKKSSLGTMATKYRASLQTEGLLKQGGKNDVPPVRLEWFMAESRQSMFGKNELVLSTTGEIKQALQELQEEGIEKSKVAFTAYQKGGYSNSALDRFAFSGKENAGNFAALGDWASDLSFDFAYRQPRSSSRGYSAQDIAMSVSNQALYTFDPDTYLSSSSTKDRVMLRLGKTNSKMAQDKGVLQGISKASWQISDCTDSLFSSFYGYEASRAQSQEDIVGLYENSGLPFDAKMGLERWLKNVRDLTEVDWESSSYYITPQSVPFYQMLTSGSYGLYSKPLNFNYSEKTKLNLILADTNPSFLLTNADPIALYGTDASFVFSGEFSAWKEKIVESVSSIKAALDPLRGASMDDYEFLSATLIKETYSNGKTLYVNKGDSNVTTSNISVPAGGYVIV